VNNAGIITTIAGTGSRGYSGDGGPAINASFQSPRYLTVDNSGNIYISDDGNECIRKIDGSGTITTIAGNGIQGYTGDGGAASAAELYFPEGITKDNSGNIYFVDMGNSRIRKISNTGIITTIAGNGTVGYGG